MPQANDELSTVLAILTGLGLAAACGFRVFLPLFIASLAARQGLAAAGDLDEASFGGERGVVG